MQRSTPGQDTRLRPRGSNHVGMRQFNERVVLQAIRLHGSLPKAEIARLTHLTAQTVQIIIARLEADGLVRKLDPVRGKVGQPSVPMALNPDGAFSIGIKIGRRSMDELLVDFSGQVRERKSGALLGQLQGSAQLLLSTTLPPSGVEGVVLCEYSAVELTPEGSTQALMRRGLGYVSGGVAQLVAEGRVEELTLQWVGNTQINPTLLGYIEGAPPVPSENLTEEDDYKGATSVTLKQSESTSYRWQRSEATNQAFSMDGFIGASWDFSAGIGVVAKTSSGRIGAAMSLELSAAQQRDSAVTTTSSSMGVASAIRSRSGSSCLPRPSATSIAMCTTVKLGSICTL